MQHQFHFLVGKLVTVPLTHDRGLRSVEDFDHLIHVVVNEVSGMITGIFPLEYSSSTKKWYYNVKMLGTDGKLFQFTAAENELKKAEVLV